MSIDRAALDGSVRTIADFAAELPGRLVGQHEYPDGSVVARHIADRMNVPSYGGFPIVREVLVAAMFASLSGINHANSWVDLVQSGRATVALATVTRGALEGLAKSYFLLSASTTKVMISRHIAVTAFDLVHPLKHTEFQDYSGRSLDKELFPKLHEEIASQLGLGSLDRPLQAMVVDLLSAGMRDGERAGREIYSQLSGPAHASMSALGMYVEPGDSHLFLPTVIAAEQAAYLFAGLCVVVESWLDVFAPGSDDLESWKVARRAAESHLIRLQVA